jgi:hypothetical protein
MKIVEVDGCKAVVLDNPVEDYELMWHAMHDVDRTAEDSVFYWVNEAEGEDAEYLNRVHSMTEEIRQDLFPGRK